MIRLFRRHTGFTLIELVLTIVLLGFVSLILIPFMQSITHSPDPMLRERAVALGQALMDEILAKRWDEYTPMGGGPIITGESPTPSGTPGACGPPCTTPNNRLYCFYTCDHPSFPAPGNASTTLGPEGVEIRANYDDVDDYNNFKETDTFQNQNGDVVANLPGYSRSVKVWYIPSKTSQITKDTAAAAGTTDTKLIVVTVKSPLETFTLVAVSCNF